MKIGGNADTCPLCQSSLTGTASPNNWPSPTRLRKQAFIYKLQLFIVLAAIIVGLSLDFLLDINNGTHYSLIISLWLIVFEWDLWSNMKKVFVISRIVSITILHVSLMLLLTAWYYNFFDLAAYLIVPILIGSALLANMTFAMIDTRGNAMVYLLENILLIFIVYAFLKAKYDQPGLIWTICLMISLVCLLGIIIFKGRKVSNEIQKRMNF